MFDTEHCLRIYLEEMFARSRACNFASGLVEAVEITHCAGSEGGSFPEGRTLSASLWQEIRGDKAQREGGLATIAP